MLGFGIRAVTSSTPPAQRPQLEQGLRALAEQHPDIAELREIGRSLENRPIWALRLGDRHGTDRKVLLLGCHHAREWISVEVPYLLTDHLLDAGGADPVQAVAAARRDLGGLSCRKLAAHAPLRSSAS